MAWIAPPGVVAKLTQELTLERQCSIFDLEELYEQLRLQRSTINDPFLLYVDNRCRKELDELLKLRPWRKRFYLVLASMMTNRRGRGDLYGPRGNKLWAMKVKAGNLNSRLVCKENAKGSIVVMMYIERHKTTDEPITRRTEGIYEAMRGYHYKELD